MNMTLQHYLDKLKKERNLSYSTIKIFKSALKQYEQLNQMTLSELLEEAEKEEEKGIRWKHRQLPQRLLQYQNHLLQHYNYTTAETYLTKVKTFYKHHLIEIHTIPRVNTINTKKSRPITYQDLPTKNTLKEAYNLAKPIMKAYILLAISTGCARNEMLRFTRNDFDGWVRGQNPNEKEIVPIIYLTRQKTNKYYYTFASPEAIRETYNYLRTRDDDDPRLFNISERQLGRHFHQLNDKLGLGRINDMVILRTHMLRKFHASQLHSGKYPLSLDEIDSLQGRSKNMIRESYYFDNPYDLREKYIRNIDQVTILDEVHTITVDSPEVMELKQKAAKIDELEKLVKKIMMKNGGTQEQ